MRNWRKKTWVCKEDFLHARGDGSAIKRLIQSEKWEIGATTRVCTGLDGVSMNVMNQYTAAVQKDGDRWVGWIEEVPGVNSQGSTRQELLENLHSALVEALQLNRREAQEAAGDNFEEIRISA